MAILASSGCFNADLLWESGTTGRLVFKDWSLPSALSVGETLPTITVNVLTADSALDTSSSGANGLVSLQAYTDSQCTQAPPDNQGQGGGGGGNTGGSNGGGNGGGSAGQVASVAPVAGVAQFAGISNEHIGTFYLRASMPGYESSECSPVLNFVAGPPYKWGAPSGQKYQATAGGGSVAVYAQLQDRYGNPTSTSGVNATFAAPGGGGTLSGTTSVTDAQGMTGAGITYTSPAFANVYGLDISGGGYVAGKIIVAVNPGPIASFSVSNYPLATNTTKAVQQNQAYFAKIRAMDVNANVVTGYTGTVTISCPSAMTTSFTANFSAADLGAIQVPIVLDTAVGCTLGITNGTQSGSLSGITVYSETNNCLGGSVSWNNGTPAWSLPGNWTPANVPMANFFAYIYGTLATIPNSGTTDVGCLQVNGSAAINFNSGITGSVFNVGGAKANVASGGTFNIPRAGGDTSTIQFNGSGGIPQVFSNQGAKLFLNQLADAASGTGHILSLVGPGGFDIANLVSFSGSTPNFLHISSNVVMGTALTIPSGARVQVDPGATLTLQAGGNIQAGGQLTVLGGGTLEIGGGQTLTDSGTLLLSGIATNTAAVRSNGTNPFSIVLGSPSASMLAGYFSIETGTVDASGSTAPLLFQNGRFSNTPLGGTALKLGTTLSDPLLSLQFSTDFGSVNYTAINGTNLTTNDVLAVDVWVAGTRDDPKSACVNGTHLKWAY